MSGTIASNVVNNSQDSYLISSNAVPKGDSEKVSAENNLDKLEVFKNAEVVYEYQAQAGDTLQQVVDKISERSLFFSSKKRIEDWLIRYNGGESRLKLAIRNGRIIEAPAHYLKQEDMVVKYALGESPPLYEDKDFCIHLPYYVLENEKLLHKFLKKAKEAKVTSIMADIKHEFKNNWDRDLVMWEKLGNMVKSYGIDHYGARVVLFRERRYINPQTDKKYLRSMLSLLNKMTAKPVFDFIALDYIRFSERLPKGVDSIDDWSRVDYIAYEVFTPIMEMLRNNQYKGELQLFLFGDVGLFTNSTIKNIGQDARILASIYRVFKTPLDERRHIRTWYFLPTNKRLELFLSRHPNYMYNDRGLTVIGEVTQEDEEKELLDCFRRKRDRTNCEVFIRLSRVVSRIYKGDTPAQAQLNKQEKFNEIGFELCYKQMPYGGTHVLKEHYQNGVYYLPKSVAANVKKFTGKSKYAWSLSDYMGNYPDQANAIYGYRLYDFLKGSGIRFETCVLGANHEGTLTNYGIRYMLWQAVASMRMGQGVTLFNPSDRDKTFAAMRLAHDFYKDHQEEIDTGKPATMPIEDEVEDWLWKNYVKYSPKYSSLYDPREKVLARISNKHWMNYEIAKVTGDLTEENIVFFKTNVEKYNVTQTVITNHPFYNGHTIIAFGDSVTANPKGYVGGLREYCPKITVENHGIESELTTQIKRRLERYLVKFQQEVPIENRDKYHFIVSGGINNVGDGMAPGIIRRAKKDLEEMYEMVRAAGANVIATTVTPMPDGTDKQKEAIDNINAFIYSQAYVEGIKVVDFYKKLDNKYNAKRYYEPDKFLPSSFGGKVLALELINSCLSKKD